MRYTVSNMAREVSFQLDTQGGEEILTNLVRPIIEQSGNAIAARARAMASSMSSNPPEISVSVATGTIKRGIRAIATIRALGNNAHENYIGQQALAKAKDAGRV